MRGTWGNAIKAHKSGVWGIFPGTIFDRWTRFAIPNGAKRAALAFAGVLWHDSRQPTLTHLSLALGSKGVAQIGVFPATIIL